MVLTTDPSYYLALRPRITIKDITGTDTLYTFNAFSGSNPIQVSDLHLEDAVGESGTFSMSINDINNQIPKDNIHNVKVFFELGKTNTFEGGHFMIAHGNIFRIDRPATNYQQYEISGFGTWRRAYDLLIHRRERYKKGSSDSKVYNIADNALTKRKWRPLKEQDESIQDITGWSRDGISTKVNTQLLTVDKAYVKFGDFMDELCDITGAVWFVDYSTGEEVFTLSYNNDLHTGIIVKSGDLRAASDDANKISYIKTAFSVEDNSSSEAGVSTRLITTTVSDDTQIFEQDTNDGNTNTVFKAIGQQVIIDNDARRITSIELLLSKHGEPDSPKGRLNGDIVLDDGNNKPSTSDGNILDEFHIDLGQIEGNAKFHKVDVDISAKKLDVAQSKIWIRIFQRSNGNDANGDPDGNGNPNKDTDHYVMWRHDNKFNVTNTLYSGTSTNNGGDEDLKSKMTWNTSNKGPLYALRINSNIRRAIARTNKRQANAILLREQFVSTEFLDDPGDISRFLSIILSQVSKPKRSVDFTVTIPNNFIFKPYQWVSFNDGLSGLSQDMQIQRATYDMTAHGGDSPMGTLNANITLSALYNTLTANCSCI